MKKVYLLEDDKSICELIACALDLSDVNVEVFNSVAEFLAAAEKELPDLSLLDIMLPDGNGLDVLKILADKGVPCIMLSALSQETDKVKGLNLGAVDYIAKPFGVLELSARVNANLRRIKTKQDIVTVGDLIVSRGGHSVSLCGQILKLNNKEYALIEFMADNVNKVLTRDRLLEVVWGYDVGETRTVDNHIARLRRMGLEDYIETVFGVGYKLVAAKKG